MPFTPYHLGPALLVGLPLRRKLHAPTLLLASVILDVEPFYVLVSGAPYPLHGYLHTFLAALLVGLGLGALMRFLNRWTAFLWLKLRLADSVQDCFPYLTAGVAGTLSHVLLDAPLYGEMEPLYPLSGNPLYCPRLADQVYGFCTATLLLGLAYYAFMLLRQPSGLKPSAWKPQRESREKIG